MINESEKLNFLKSLLGDFKFSSNTKEATFSCPFPSCKNKYKKKLSVNLSNDYFKCWVCNSSGRSLIPILKLLNATPGAFYEYKTKYKADNVIVQSQKDKDFILSLPEEYEPLVGLSHSKMAKRAFDYLKSRNIEEETILKFKLGFCSTGDFSDRIIIPSFSKDGNLNFYTGRTIDPESKLSYLNDKNLPKGYKNTVILNELNVDFSKEVAIVEGFFDLFNSIPNTIPLCGSTLSKDSLLFKTLVENETTVILALDPDAFLEKTLKIAKLMMSFNLNVFIADFSPFKDLGSMNKKEGISRIENAELVSNSFIFKNKLRGYISA